MSLAAPYEGRIARHQLVHGSEWIWTRSTIWYRGGERRGSGRWGGWTTNKPIRRRRRRVYQHPACRVTRRRTKHPIRKSASPLAVWVDDLVHQNAVLAE